MKAIQKRHSVISTFAMDKLKPSKVQELERLVDEACADHTRGIPGATFVVVDKDGKELLAHSAGRRGSGSTEPMTLDNIFWIASCTKMLTGIACMQLVEQGKLSLDDVRQVEQLSPELKDVKVLQSDGTLVEKKKGITLRMLLTHTGECLDLMSVHRTDTNHSRFWIHLFQRKASRPFQTYGI